MESLWRAFYRDKQSPILRVTLETAEMIKYTSNALLATKISFANTIANILSALTKLRYNRSTQRNRVELDHQVNLSFLDIGLGYYPIYSFALASTPVLYF